MSDIPLNKNMEAVATDEQLAHLELPVSCHRVVKVGEKWWMVRLDMDNAKLTYLCDFKNRSNALRAANKLNQMDERTKSSP